MTRRTIIGYRIEESQYYTLPNHTLFETISCTLSDGPSFVISEGEERIVIVNGEILELEGYFDLKDIHGELILFDAKTGKGKFFPLHRYMAEDDWRKVDHQRISVQRMNRQYHARLDGDLSEGYDKICFVLYVEALNAFALGVREEGKHYIVVDGQRLSDGFEQIVDVIKTEEAIQVFMRNGQEITKVTIS